MSTFDGVVAEFPNIRIDYFRPSSSYQPPNKAPLAFFLSHVHSDHLVGLETCKSPFIYCSPATRDILLRLEKYHHRMNFARGIVEARCQTYKHLKTLLKAIPLDTPTKIELAPGSSIRVTLIDANHCVGSVMFLIEGDGGKAILYTGDIRAELWWVTSLTRHSALMPYVVLGDDRRLDAIYLDTTFATKQDSHRDFPEKAVGIQELLLKIDKYPSDTVFYFDAWTFGYEEVWITLAAFLGTQIHVDDYRYGLYRALAHGMEPKAPETSKLVGYSCGNHYQEGCLTRQSASSRVHSCEKGTGCDIWTTSDFVRITPIVSRHRGVDIAELGAGGGHGDLKQQQNLDIGDLSTIKQIMSVFPLNPQKGRSTGEYVRSVLTNAISEDLASIPLDLSVLADEDYGPGVGEGEPIELDNMKLDEFLPYLEAVLKNQKKQQEHDEETGRRTYDNAKTTTDSDAPRQDILPRRIAFPYSRHSSYNELCSLVKAFKPKEVHPCTVDETGWTEARSMGSLFGHLYERPPEFRHDLIMFQKYRAHLRPKEAQEFASTSGLSPSMPDVNDKQDTAVEVDTMAEVNRDVRKRHKTRFTSPYRCSKPHLTDQRTLTRAALREQAYNAALGIDGLSWSDIDLISVRGHQAVEEEL